MMPMRWAIIGPGKIARRFAEAVNALPDASLVAVIARDGARGAGFASAWQAPDAAPIKVYTDLAQALGDDGIDAVYIATPHSAHGEAIQACLIAGKPVLCEKPLVPSAAIAEPLLALAQARGVFLMEAVWTRFLPIYQQMGRWLASGAIGRLRSIQSSFCFAANAGPESRVFSPALAGGALLDIGIYNLTAIRWALAQQSDMPALVDMHVDGVLAKTGVDERISAQLRFADGCHAQFVCAFDAIGDNSLRLIGDGGYIVVPEMFWQGTRASLHVAGCGAEQVEAPFEINGFEYEIREAMRCIRAGLIESPIMSHAETLAMLRWMDAIRERVGVKYPFEA
ncbi:Gfo/Idh/MocA family protein [Chitinimonas sp. BJYL2]|uniref:Gfo/Idh/MocA family protein n=1 Tax=Chitinimonas sp. BJYL2 TaxID=2976696 RepID=UPI0022B3A71A|nr:Gfo/Idh/MocA family oxidoreductase [Chitinimonas sp. BJYL2]